MSKRAHIRRDQERTFCNNLVVQDTKEGKREVHLTNPELTDCSVCLANYYHANPLQLARTRVKLGA